MTRLAFMLALDRVEDAIMESKNTIRDLESNRERIINQCQHWDVSIDTSNEHGIPVKRCDLCGREVE